MYYGIQSRVWQMVVSFYWNSFPYNQLVTFLSVKARLSDSLNFMIDFIRSYSKQSHSMKCTILCQSRDINAVCYKLSETAIV